jgi:PAS domain S-box-containing protein
MPRAAVESAIRRAVRSSALLPALAALLAAEPVHAATVRLQLKWRHQFQFAGYYAAQAQGFYAAEGLEVEILEGGPERPPIEAVAAGRADFGVGDAEVLLARLRGAPLVALAAVFQHSPYVLVSRKDRGIRTPADLIGRRVMVAHEQGMGQVRAMLLHEGIDAGRVAIVEEAWRLEDLAEGRADAVFAYATVEPARLRAGGIEPSLLRAVDYGVDFYGDTLFTTEARLRSDPEGVAAFRRATLRGWAYALQHVDETAARIAALPGVAARGVTRETLAQEAGAMLPFILPDVVEIGHMNEGRWRKIAADFVAAGLAPSPARAEGFAYEPQAGIDGGALRRLTAVALLAAAVAAAFALWNVQMRRSVRERTRELQDSRRRLMSIYDTVGDSLFLVAVEQGGGFRFESVNQRFVGTTGVPAEQVVGRRVEDVIPAESRELVLARYRAAVGERQIVRWEETTTYPAGRLTGEVSVAPVLDEQGACTHLVGAVHDITARKLAEDMLRQSQKLESVGRLAGGIAHDFNNLVNVILGYGALALRGLAAGDPVRSRIDQMLEAAVRAGALTRQLLAFSRQQVMQPRLLDLGVVVRDMGRMLQGVLGDHLELVTVCAEGIGAVSADPTQVEQVVMNLVVNARDAMPQGGRLTIETANADFDDTYAAAHPPALPGRFVMLAVTDTGTGMDAETQRRLFEPFFTTKPAGKGTGLGLPTVYGIVKQMGGYVWVYSEVGRGSCFKVYLPRSGDAAPAAPPAKAASAVSGGSETILVAEDSQSLRALIQEVLSEQGYQVITAREGQEALAIVESRAGSIDLLLTDVVMPNLGGADLVRQLRRVHPRLRAVYMSGYTNDAIARDLLEADAVLLEKPFTGDALSRAVRQALDRAP